MTSIDLEATRLAVAQEISQGGGGDALRLKSLVDDFVQLAKQLVSTRSALAGLWLTPSG